MFPSTPLAHIPLFFSRPQESHLSGHPCVPWTKWNLLSQFLDKPDSPSQCDCSPGLLFTPEGLWGQRPAPSSSRVRCSPVLQGSQQWQPASRPTGCVGSSTSSHTHVGSKTTEGIAGVQLAMSPLSHFSGSPGSPGLEVQELAAVPVETLFWY